MEHAREPEAEFGGVSDEDAYFAEVLASFGPIGPASMDELAMLLGFTPVSPAAILPAADAA